MIHHSRQILTSGPARRRQGRLFLTRSEAPLDVDTPGDRRLLSLLVNDDLLHAWLQRQRELLRAGPLRGQASLEAGLGRSKDPELRLRPCRRLTALGQRVCHLQRQADLLNSQLQRITRRPGLGVSQLRPQVSQEVRQANPILKIPHYQYLHIHVPGTHCQPLARTNAMSSELLILDPSLGVGWSPWAGHAPR
jgi:hypothetical protein